MKISTVLDHIDSGHMALPEFQRGYVWNRDQVRGLFDSLYRRHPVGGLLVWATESRSATHRGDGPLAAGVVKLLLDGQQRMTSLYGVVRGRPPRFFDGNAKAFTGLRFHLDSETFEFFQPVKMKDDPLWIDVNELLKKGTGGLGDFVTRLSAVPAHAPRVGEYVARLSRLLGITDIDVHVEEVTGADKSLDVVVDIFNRVNSGGTKLSKGDLALAKICADWPEGRDAMKAKLAEWAEHGFRFNLDWLLRSVNTVLTGEAKFQHLHEKTADEVRDALARACKHVGAEPGHFTGWSLGARFYPVLYLLTRMGEARDWGTGLPLKASLLGRMSRLEVHHIFPKAQLRKRKHPRPEVNALANFCFLTKDTNLDISDRLPEEYFPEIERNHPGALASQWIPNDPALWKIERFRDFLEARKALLAAELNRRMADLLHGDDRWLAGAPAALEPAAAPSGGITTEEEEQELEGINAWMEGEGLPRGELSWGYADPESGRQRAVFDLAWPMGVQEELSQPVAVLLNEDSDTLAIASAAGFRCFTDTKAFKRYVRREVLATDGVA